MSRNRPIAKLCLLVGTAAIWLPQAAQAETLADALALAYRTNPSLQGARADLRAVDEDYVQARAGWGPQAEVSLQGQYSDAQQRNIFGARVDAETNAGNAGLVVAQPLYTGGRVGAQVIRSLRDIDSERERLRAVEAEVLFDVVQSYSDVLRDQQSLAIRQGTLETYRRQVDEITARVRAGELTRTDIAQAQSQFESERALVNNAMAQLEVSRSAYVAVVGQNPGTLAPQPTLPGLPASSEEAFVAADTVNPQLLQAIHQQESASARVSEARAAYRPNVSLRATYGFTGVVTPFGNYDRALVGQVTLSQPLFSAGQRGSAVRQAEARTQSSRSAVDGARRGVVQTVANAWNAMVTARTNRDTAAAAVAAAQVAVQGMQIEFRADLRSTFDVLNAEDRLNSAQLFLLAAEHDQVVAAARLLAVTGRLEAKSLLAALPAYDPNANFLEVRNKGSFPTDRIAALLDSIAPPRGASMDPAPAPPAAAQPPQMTPAKGALPANAPLTNVLPIAKTSAAATLAKLRR